MMDEQIIVVDEDDKEIGLLSKEKCHDGKGILHRAFLAIVMNNKKEVFLCKRSSNKRLWPDIWDGSIASHIHKGETYESATIRRAKEELGIKVKDAKFLFKFRYQIPYSKSGGENEICGVMLIEFDGEIKPNKEEISQVKKTPINRIAKEIEDKKYAPWMQIAFRKIIKEKIL
jgi:isopentenyl-diphosphate Delta-isomerase